MLRSTLYYYHHHNRGGHHAHTIVAAAVAAVATTSWLATGVYSTITERPKDNNKSKNQHRLFQQQQQQQPQQHQLSNLIALHTGVHATSYCHGAFASPPSPASAAPTFTLKRQSTIELLNKTATKEKTVDSLYDVMWENPIGVGNYGNVYKGRHRHTHKPVAVKKISKQFTNDTTFQREMDILLHLERTGGHPSICLMHEHFEEGDSYYLVFDLIEGGELFDQLCQYGAYSEADAARFIKEAASAIAFLHGVGVVHSDVKPENVMLSSSSKKDGSVKIVDFGCAHLIDEDTTSSSSSSSKGRKNDHQHQHRGTGLTPAYCPPEIVSHLKNNPGEHASIEPSFDMWSLGVIMYIILTGAHPFDLAGDADADTMAHNILNQTLPIRNHSRTAHLSEDALNLLERLMERDATKRMTAAELLETDWVRGKTASSSLIKGSDRRLAEYRRHQTKIGSSIFKGLLNQADKEGGSDFAKRTSIIEIAFRDLDPENRGYISTKELTGLTSFFAPDAKLSLSEVQHLLSENMVSKYFKKGDVIYEEGANLTKGGSMFFVHSGTVEVSERDGFRVVRNAGQFFGEEAFNSDTQSHMQTVKCLTPVHVLEISRDYFEKYLKADEDVFLHMAETKSLRQREHARVMFGLSKDLKPKDYKRGQVIFREQQDGDDLYIMDNGTVDITVGGRKVRTLAAGEITGEHAAFYSHKPYNVTATCRTDACRMQVLNGKTIRKLCETNKLLSDSFKDIILRRDFKKAVVMATHQDFPQSDKELRHVFSLIDSDENGEIQFETLKKFVIQWDPEYTDEDVRQMLKSLNLRNTGAVSWSEFKRVFSMFNES